ncbi:hypothetical protein RHGRI_027210 [Rhododendron griersonianum]|uniref:Uncharacterized protein n=1 Tax=Rhododendron griersonianum TaxID=479676 RepID=A0AAV6IZ07_9ERIC|nr:hypothetical protein RHGRI_027210 [Rhododendron griersonianum]KAG5532843.1 hypothetical protein RHGRI_027210 [Rhododendron griersonianum]
MGTALLLQFPSSSTAPSPPPPPLLLSNRRNTLLPGGTRCPSTGHGGRSGRPHWDYNAEKTHRAERFRFNYEDDVGREKDVGGGFGFREGAKKRVWWSDEDMDDDADDKGGFGGLEEALDTSWILKILNALGWMLPAIGISMLLGTGPNPFLMALVLPLAQSAVSLAIDTFWGKPSRSTKPKGRTKKKPFSRAASSMRTSEDREDFESGNVRESYQSWTAANDISTKQTRDKRASSFGGWDELDKSVGSYKVPKRAPTQRENEPQQQKRGKLSRRVKNRETPLLLRLLIAVFPFLGSWTKLL